MLYKITEPPKKRRLYFSVRVTIWLHVITKGGNLRAFRYGIVGNYKDYFLHQLKKLFKKISYPAALY